MTLLSSESELRLLDVTLKNAGAIIKSVTGEFTAPSKEEIAVLRAGGTVELYKIDNSKEAKGDNDKEQQQNEDDDDDEEPRITMKLVCRVETRSTVRDLVVVRQSGGGNRDFLAVSSDSGALSVMDFEHSKCKVVHCPVYGKTGCRRGIPGQYLASDPKGRAVLIGAIEKRKLVYVLNRDSSENPTVASPLEAHRSRTISLTAVGLDNGYDNPIFASLEYQYPELDEDTSVLGDPLAAALMASSATAGDDTKASSGENSGTADGNPPPSQAAPSLPDVEKQLAYYELDLGLNHVSRRWAAPTHRSACCLAAVPGGADGPGGVLVGGEDWIEYMHEGGNETAAAPMDIVGTKNPSKRIICAIPRRALHPPNKGILITAMTVHRLKKKGKFFALAQSELGDVYKVTLQMDQGETTTVLGMTIALLDTLPVANGLNVSKLGMLFVPAEFGDHALYKFMGIDVEGVAPTCTSEEAMRAYMADSGDGDDYTFFSRTENAAKVACTFHPTTLQNLLRLYNMESLAATTDVLVGELAGNEVSPQIYTLNGRGPRSTLRILRHGVAVTEVAVSELPGVPGAVYTVRDNSEEAQEKKKRYDKYIIVSFADATLVLSVGETVEEMGRESGFLTNAPTLACSSLGNDGGVCQVHPGGVRHIQKGRAKQWHCPGLKRIETASANESQVIIALAGGEVIYFELDSISGNLTESATREMGADVSCLDVGTVQTGRSRSIFAAVGCRDQTVRIISLAPGNLLVQKSSTALNARPHSVVLQYMRTTTASDSATSAPEDVVLTVGLDDGSSLRADVDPVAGFISASPTRRFLGARPVSASRITLESSPATLLLSSRPWISRPDPTSGKTSMAPLSYVPLDHGCSFVNDKISEGVVATAGSTLRILAVEVEGTGLGSEDEAFNSNRVELRYTPRQMCLLPIVAAQQQENSRRIVLAMVESDYNDYGMEEKKALGFDPTGAGKESGKKEEKKKDDDGDAMDLDEESDDDDEDKKDEDKGDKKSKKKDDDDNDDDDDDDDDDDEEKEARSTPIRGPVPESPGHWGSCVRLVDPSDACATLDCVEMGRNEAALCCASVRFHSRGGEALFAVGTVTGMTMHPLKHVASHVILYRVINGERLQLLHRTKVDGGPVLALAHFQGRLLVGAGRTLRLYEMGKRQLLRKCELRGLPTMVKTLQAAGERAYVGDLLQSMYFVRYDATANRLVVVANDRMSRPITCQEVLDLNTVAVGDKFGNITVLRLPRGADATAVDVSGSRALWESSREDSTPKLDMLCHYHVGEVVTGMTRASLVAGGAESIIYVTITGRVGALVPFVSREDVEFYTQLESSLRVDAPRPTGREPQAYRSYYAPSKFVIDGGLCAVFTKLSLEEQRKIAERVDRTVGEVTKKLEDTRNALL